MEKKEKFKFSTITEALKRIHSIRKNYLPVLSFMAIIQGFKPFIPIVLSAKIIDELMGDRDVNTLMILAALLVGTLFIIHIIGSYLTKRYEDEAFALHEYYQFEIAKKCMRLEFTEVENKDTLDLLQKIREARNNHLGLYHIADYLQKGALAIIEIVVATTLMTAMLKTSDLTTLTGLSKFMNSPLAMVVLFSAIFVGIIMLSILQNNLGQIAANAATGGIYANRTFHYLFFLVSFKYENGKDIRVYNSQKMLQEKVNTFVNPFVEKDIERVMKPNFKNYAWLNVVNVLMMLVIYTFIIMKAYIGAITVGAIFVQINAIMRLYQSFGSFLKQYNMLKAACINFKMSNYFFELPESEQKGTESIDSNETLIFEFKNVSFAYPGSKNKVLNNINIKFEPNEKLAIVGMNGAGKTTLIKLLCRLYEPTSGEILLNGRNINTIKYEDYIQLFSVVFQDFNIFAFEMDKNVAMGEQVDEAKLREVLNDAGLANVVDSLEGNLSIPVGKNFDEDGRDFSGGEKQKLAIARALYKNAPMVILDEPTAALDPIAEYEIYARFNELVNNKSAVFISHRLSSCRFCHRIAVFDQGQLVQLDDHDTLVQDENGKYYELWHAQAGHYVYDSIS